MGKSARPDKQHKKRTRCVLVNYGERRSTSLLEHHHHELALHLTQHPYAAAKCTLLQIKRRLFASAGGKRFQLLHGENGGLLSRERGPGGLAYA
jgi:hypothetical protein